MSEINFETWVKELADAIRTKKGTSDKIKALDYKQEILSIETGASGEPIIIETEEDFNALLENATQEDDGKIYLYNDNLYKLNYNETTTIRTLEIVANGEYDVALYDKVNVQVQSESSGASVEYLGGTALPTSGTISKIYFNVDRNPKDLLKIAKTLTYDYAVGSMGNAFPMVKSSSGDGLGILKLEMDEGTYYILARLSDVKMFWFGIGEQAQWGDGTSNSMVSEFELNWEIVQGGENNDLLKDFVSITPFDQINIQKISGTLDGRPITIVENAPIFMDNYIRENKLPMQINVDVKFGDFVPYDNNEIKNVFINTSLTNEEVDYELSKLNYAYYNINFYVFVGNENQNGITIYEEDTTKHQIVFSKYNSNTSEYEKIIIYDTINGNGWVEETISTYLPNNVIELPTTSPIGSQNNLIKKVISAVLEVDENGTYDTTKYGATIVNVASSGEDMLQTRVDATNSCKYLMAYFDGSNVDFISNLDTSNVTNMSYMFYYCEKLTAIPQLDTSNVTDISYMFYSCSKLTTIPQLDTNKVTTMYYMFKDCQVLTTIPLLNTSNVTNMSYMFDTCRALITIPQLDTSKVTSMASMFKSCSKLTNIPQLDTSNVTSMYYTFNSCSQLTAIPQLDTSKVSTMQSMFYYCTNLTTIPQLDTSQVNNMSYMFNGCSKLTTISLLDMRSVSSTSSMFYDCKNLTNLTLKNIKVNLQIGSGTSWGHLLTLESLLNTCQECINVNSSRTLTMGSANLEKLASVYVKLTGVAEEDETLPKLPMVQCESGDEGAMTIQDYMAMKNWTLA